MKDKIVRFLSGPWAAIVFFLLTLFLAKVMIEGEKAGMVFSKASFSIRDIRGVEGTNETIFSDD